MDITDLLVMTKQRGASDLHLSAGAPPTLRINGELLEVVKTPLTGEDLHTLLYDVLTDEQKARFEATHDLDFALELSNLGRFRVNAFVQRRGGKLFPAEKLSDLFRRFLFDQNEVSQQQLARRKFFRFLISVF